MRRRDFISALAGFACISPRTARAQKRNPSLGVLYISNTSYFENAFQQGLADFGYIIEQNISVIRKDASGSPDQVNQFATELVQAKVDVIFGASSQATSALQHQTNTIPIVTMSTNPVGLGFAASLARPGGNITGISLVGPEVAAKRLQLLKELIPEAVRAAVLWNPDDPGAQFSLAETQAASKALMINLRSFETRTAGDIDTAFSAAAKEAVQAVILLPAPFMAKNASRISELALANRLPTFAFFKHEARAGELISFGPDLPAAARRAAYFVDRILKGTSPSDLPIEQPTKFELVINLKTAKALGLDVPPSLLARADEVIE